MNYTKSDYDVLKKALEDMIHITKYVNDLILKLEIERVLFDEDGVVLENISDLIDKQKYFNVTNYKKNSYIDVSYENLLFSIYNTNNNDVFLGEGFEVWNDNEGYCIGVFSIVQIKDILNLRGNK